MSKVITFSRFFPSYHPRKGEPTYFVEKFLNSLPDRHNYFAMTCDDCGYCGMSNTFEGGGQIAYTGDYGDLYCPKCKSTNLSDWSLTEDYYIGKYEPKHHIIRAGHRFKVGEWFKPVVWALPGGRFTKGNKQIIIAPDIQVKRVWKFEANHSGYAIDGYYYSLSKLREVAKNDGFTNSDDFELWFNLKKDKTLESQIICWNEDIDY